VFPKHSIILKLRKDGICQHGGLSPYSQLLGILRQELLGLRVRGQPGKLSEISTLKEKVGFVEYIKHTKV
jgi:hypothetical protein